MQRYMNKGWIAKALLVSLIPTTRPTARTFGAGGHEASAIVSGKMNFYNAYITVFYTKMRLLHLAITRFQ